MVLATHALLSLVTTIGPKAAEVRQPRRWIRAGLGAILTSISASVFGLEGIIIDRSTERPLPAVYVVGAWDVSISLIVEARTRCAKLELVQTDARGRFRLPDHATNVVRALLVSETLYVWYYKPGYRWVSGDEWKGEKILMEPDTRTPLEHIGDARDVMARADCGADEQSKKNRLRLYQSMYDEAARIARTLEERIEALRILYAIDTINDGYDAAILKLRAREAEERTKR